ncbi:MAG: response regulator [Lachnospiraceae bacterium]|nr:response regulator [Lachnospiraceae bacterium]
MKKENQSLSSLINFIFPKGYDIQVSAFNILAVCGVIVCIITAFYNLMIGLGFIAFAENILGALFSFGLMLYTRITGNYKRAMILTVLVIFIGLFSLLFFSGGGYHSGIPSFFIFGVVFTAFMLDGIIMPVLVITELVWYAGLCLYAYYNPLPVDLFANETTYMVDVIVCETIVSVSLAITMYLQIKIYRNKQEELNKATLEAKNANRAKSDFLAKMSHDIRTPLNTILAMNELIITNTSSVKIREWVNDSNISGHILLSLIDDMLDLSRIESGRVILLDHIFEPKRLFDEIARMWSLQADKEELEFEYICDINDTDTYFGDENAIRKITNNLLSNAVKYTKSGKVSLNLSYEEMLIIKVKDTGIGIAEEYFENIFKPFERGVQEIYRETSGTGLGLAIVKDLADAMEGSIECESVIGQGTEFIVKLPVKESGRDKGKSPDKKNTKVKSRSYKQFVAPNAHILVVDDNIYNRKVIDGFLESTLIQIDDVESGYEALEMIDIKDYDLVLMDLRMPKMDGVETLKRIRNEYPEFSAPVVVLSADIMNGIEERLLQEGFTEFLSKPLSSERLLETISSLLPDKVIPLETEGERGLIPVSVESYKDILMPYGIDLRLALEYNAGNSGEFLTRVELFEEYADSEIQSLKDCKDYEDYYIKIHSLKSVSKGVGAYFLSELSETVEFRKDNEYSKVMNPVILDEYKRVYNGLKLLMERLEKHNGSKQSYDNR